MERTIAIANQKTQQRYSLKSHATTLGELQDEMTRAGIDFTGMQFTEGISKTTLYDRNSQLPSNVMFKGQPTNDLVMLLTNTTKNIASGACERSRKDAYAAINAIGDQIKEFFKENYGRNYTQIPTESLWEEIDAFSDGLNDEEEEKEEEKEEVSTNDDTTNQSFYEYKVEGGDLISEAIQFAHQKGLIDRCDLGDILAFLTSYIKHVDTTHPTVSDEDIDEMMRAL